MEESVDKPDESNVAPVSTLRSKFESLGKNAGSTGSGASNALPEHNNSQWSIGNGAQAPPVPRKLRPDVLRSRPRSMISLEPLQHSPPLLVIDSPTSPPKSSEQRRVTGPILTSQGHIRTQSHIPITSPEANKPTLASFLEKEPKPSSFDDSVLPPLGLRPHNSTVAPPVNRAAKPKIPAKSPALSQNRSILFATETTAEPIDRSVSPFTTPPSSGKTTPDGSQNAATRGQRADSDASWVQRLRGDSSASTTRSVRTDSNASWVEASTIGEAFPAPPLHHAVAVRREQQANGMPAGNPMPSRPTQSMARNGDAHHVPADNRMRLPPRPDFQARLGTATPTKIRSGRVSPVRSLDMPRRQSTDSDRIPKSNAGPQVIQRSALALGFDRPLSRPPSRMDLNPPPTVPAPRRSADRRREAPPILAPEPVQPQTPSDERNLAFERRPEIAPVADTAQIIGPSDFPDSTGASRKPPRYKQRPWQIPTEYDTRLYATCGGYVCTSGYVTKAWSLKTGEMVLNMAHQESVKVTSIVFKPAVQPQYEGECIWLGTNTGEIVEIDVPSQSVIKTIRRAHRGREIVKMHRHGHEVWTLDDNGELVVWRGDMGAHGSLDSQNTSFRVTKGHSFSIVCDARLWIASGKDIRVYALAARTDSEFYLTQRPLTQPNIGDITSGATIDRQSALVYFGHSDGKVSIYNRRSLDCTGVVYVSLYKISCLAGVGDHLWAGYGTGMAYVYDTRRIPWTVKKDWPAHEKNMCGIAVDSSQVQRKTQGLRVVTLATDNLLRIWDGSLEDDWLEAQMQQRQAEYCTFDEMTVSVLTWNAGASKPSHLQHSPDDNRFFGEYIRSARLPDVFVFGFQELVDLEDKKLTAKSLFKSKKKDAFEQGHMGHEFRAWRDHLSRCMQEHMPTSEPFTVLHSASMIGLFTCVFVKLSVRHRIKHVHQAEVKRGMGGHYGNKGALVLRLILDDSSISFTNCHLAAGQTQTANRNNDIAAILEADCLPAYPLGKDVEAHHSDVFVSGGDGSMILDHEICIVNGDLNYRIDTMGRDTVIKHIQQGNLARLLERDQLALSRKKNPGFRLRAFQESRITFDPTYKYNVRSDVYDTSEKRRAPAWCDRILYRGMGNVKCEEYRRWEVRVSDHRPVSAKLKCRVKTVDTARREKVWQRCIKDLEAQKQMLQE